MNFEQIFYIIKFSVACLVIGLVGMEGMTLSGHLSNINEMGKLSVPSKVLEIRYDAQSAFMLD